MDILSKIENLLQTTTCSTKHFILDKENYRINCLDKNAVLSCRNGCILITQATWLLIQNSIDYTITKDFDLILYPKEEKI